MIESPTGITFRWVGQTELERESSGTTSILNFHGIFLLGCTENTDWPPRIPASWPRRLIAFPPTLTNPLSFSSGTAGPAIREAARENMTGRETFTMMMKRGNGATRSQATIPCSTEIILLSPRATPATELPGKEAASAKRIASSAI